MIALFVLAIIMSACLYSILRGLQLSRDNQDRVVAAHLVTGVLEQLRSGSLTTTGFEAIPITTQTLTPQTVGGTVYNFSEDNEWVYRGMSGNACNAGTNASLILRSTVTSTWSSDGESVSESTLIAPPNGALSASDGSLPVEVNSSTNSGYAGATVTASDPAIGSSYTITTGSDGCAFFAQLPPSTSGNSYTVTVSSTGGVSSAEQATFSTSVQINSGQQASLAHGAVSYDTAGAISWAYSSTTLTPALNMPISIGTQALPLTDYLYPYTSAATLTPVFPATYTDVFAGGCTDANPAGLDKNNNAFYTSPVDNVVTVAPGSTATTTVPIYPLTIEIVNSANQPVPNATSVVSSPPSAVPGATSLAGGAACPSTPLPYTLTRVTNNGTLSTSTTGVGLGHLAISVTVAEGGSTHYSNPTAVNVWVRPDGVYKVNSDGTVGALIYSFASPGVVMVPVQ